MFSTTCDVIFGTKGPKDLEALLNEEGARVFNVNCKEMIEIVRRNERSGCR